MYTIDNSVSSKSNMKNKLEGGKIHNVFYKGAVAQEIESKKDGKKYNIITFKWENEHGTFEDAVFEPSATDEKRTENATFGGENVSRVEEMMAKFRHVIAATNPKLDAEIEAKTKNLTAKSWKHLTDIMIKATSAGIDKEMQIKLFPNKDNTQGVFPAYFLGISRAGNVYMRTNFIGSDLQFTPTEIKRLDTISTAKPTKMKSEHIDGLDDIATDTPAAGAIDNDMDFDIDDL